MKVVEVVHLIWVDSQAQNEWTVIADLKGPLVELHAVGFLIYSTKEHFVLAVSLDPETDSANAIMSIPRKAVKKVRTLCAMKIS